MNEVDPQKYLLFLGLLEEYVVTGAIRSISKGQLTYPEMHELFKLARLRYSTPYMFNKYLFHDDEGDTMSHQLILFKDVDKLQPKAEFVDVCKKFDKSTGIAFVDKGQLTVIRKLGALNAEEMHGNLESMLDCPIISVHSNRDTSIDYVQPFNIIGEGKNPKVAAFYQGGDTAGFEKIKNKLLKEYAAAKDDLEAFWTAIGDPDTRGEIEDKLMENSCLILISETGSVRNYENAEIETETEWGFKYGEPKPATGGNVEPKPADGFKGRGLSAMEEETLKEDKPTIEQPPSDVPMARITNQKTRKVEVVTRKPDERWIRCPASTNGHVTTKEENHAWHLKYFNIIPENWKPRPIWPVSRMVIPLETDKTSTTIPPTAGKDSATVHVSPGMAVNKAKLDDLNSTLAHLLGANPGEITNFKNIYDVDSKVPSLASMIGKLHISEMVFPWNARLGMATQQPFFAARFWGDMQVLVYQQMERIAELELNNQAQEKEITDLKSAMASGTKVSRGISAMG